MHDFVPPRIAIIGGGLAGATAAWALRKRGAEVTIFEQHKLASGASGAAVGALQPLPGMRLGLREDNIRGFFRTHQLLEELCVRDRTWREPGILRLTTDDAQRSLWEERFAQLPPGLAEWREGSHLRALEPRLTDAVRAGVFIPQGTIVDMRAFVQALVDISDARLYEGMRVHSIKEVGSELELSLSEGHTARFDYVVVASGAQAPEPLADKEVELSPYMGILAAFAGIEPPKVAINHRGYIAGWRDNSVLVGTVDRRPPYADEPTDASVRELRSRLDQVLNIEGEEPRLLRVWTGIRPALGDHTPLVRPSTEIERAWFFTGFGGRGLLLGPILAESLAEKMLGT